jgi:predicted N-acetyltransferase YhbS
MSEIIITTLKPEYAPALAAIQRASFPTLDPAELLQVKHFLKHYELFPEGNFVALVDGQPVGLGAGFLTNFDFENCQHRFSDMIAGGFFTNHDPDGDWYYGGDISVHPDYRRRGIGARLYAARKDVVKRLNRKGIVAGGFLPGYIRYKGKISVPDYVAGIVAGEIYDSTLSFQLSQGFTVRGMLENYMEDSASDHWAALIAWENPDYRPP